jgi:hypothetical protein
VPVAVALAALADGLGRVGALAFRFAEALDGEAATAGAGVNSGTTNSAGAVEADGVGTVLPAVGGRSRGSSAS